jgi:hypothetical protein
VLRQRAEGTEPGAERDNHVGLGNQLHRRLRSLIAERARPQPMVRREAVIVEIAVDHGRVELLGEPDAFVDAVREDDPATGDDDREPRLGQELGRLLETVVCPGPERHPARLGDLVIGLAVEIVARDVELRRPALAHGHVEAAGEQLGDPGVLADMRLKLGDAGKDRQLIGLLKAAEPHGVGPGLRSDDDDRRVGPVCGGDRGHEIGDAGAVLRDADAMPPRRPGIAVGHMARALLMHGRYEADAGGRKQIEGIHIGRADDAEHVLDALRHQGFDECFGRCHSCH